METLLEVLDHYKTCREQFGSNIFGEVIERVGAYERVTFNADQTPLFGADTLLDLLKWANFTEQTRREVDAMLLNGTGGESAGSLLLNMEFVSLLRNSYLKMAAAVGSHDEESWGDILLLRLDIVESLMQSIQKGLGETEDG